MDAVDDGSQTFDSDGKITMGAPVAKAAPAPAKVDDEEEMF